MDQPLLTRLFPWALAIAVLLAACSPFDDPLLELDPALRDSTLEALSASEHHPVARRHILESFGSYGCVSCPDAESRLAPYIHPALGHPGYDPELVVVNYHVKFGSIADPWVTPSIQAWNDRKGYVSLPQAVMDGSNAAYRIREKDVAFKEGEYDSLIARVRRADASSWLDLRLDTAGIAYDTAAGRIRFGFRIRNLDTEAAGPMDFRVLVVKNKPAVIPIYPTPWEVIVVETADTDATGKKLSLAGLGGLTAKAFSLDFSVPPEAGKHVRPPPLGPETLADYALVVLAQDANGLVLNVAAYKYGPK
ncbi:MAG TPA: hypothetical protein VJ385_22790 [Fibrobacteria bacterium]|nr:hypothetical protein [Fibrobacteria bacterium]